MNHNYLKTSKYKTRRPLWHAAFTDNYRQISQKNEKYLKNIWQHRMGSRSFWFWLDANLSIYDEHMSEKRLHNDYIKSDETCTKQYNIEMHHQPCWNTCCCVHSNDALSMWSSGGAVCSPLNQPGDQPGELVVQEITIKTMSTISMHVFPRLRLPSNWLQLPAVKLLSSKAKTLWYKWGPALTLWGQMVWV